MEMKISENAKKLLAKWEGFDCNVYKDVKGLPTIGVGHLLTADELSSGNISLNGQPVVYRNGISEQQVYDLLDQDLDRFERAVNQFVTVTLDQNQFDALVSFAFNVGIGSLKDSTLLKRLNAGAYAEVPNQLRRWSFADGKQVQGLLNRRENEIKLWNGDL
jgi:lysozyme